MYKLIKKNKRKSWFVFFGMGLLLLSLGGAIGFLVEQSENGIILGVIVASCLWMILALVAMTNGAKVILQGMNAHAITPNEDKVLYNVVEELSPWGVLYVYDLSGKFVSKTSLPMVVPNYQTSLIPDDNYKDIPKFIDSPVFDEENRNKLRAITEDDNPFLIKYYFK